MSIREEFYKEFPDLKWSTTGGTGDIADWWIATLKERIEGMKQNGIGEAIQNSEGGFAPSQIEIEREETWNTALDTITRLLE